MTGKVWLFGIMMVLVIGGSGSGKSFYAEETAVSLAQSADMKKYYLATMQIYDAEGQSRGMRHRKLRSGKGFCTIEQPTGIHRALEKMEVGEKTVLLECMSNLIANEMFPKEGVKPETEVVENVMRGVALLKEKTTHFVVVSNNVFEDGNVYDRTTMEYIRAMGVINRKLAALADKIVEVAAGIPICML